MGIYSNMAAELLKEQEVAFDPNAAGLLEFAVNSQRAEHAMFETMLELDVAEYYVESGTLVLTEEEKEEGAGNAIKNIGKKIAEAIEKFIQTVQLFIDKIVNFVAEKTKIDKKLIEKFGKKLDLKKAQANNPDKEVVISDPSVLNKSLITFIGARSSQSRSVAAGNTKVEDVDIENVKKNLEDIVNDETFKSVFTKKKISELKAADVAGFVSNVDGGYGKLVEEIIGKAAKESLKVAKAARMEVLKGFGKKDADREDLAKRFKYVSQSNAAVSKAINFGSTIATKAMAESRNAYVAIAMAANKKEKTEKEAKPKNEAAELDYEDILEFALENATDNMYADLTVG